MTSRPDRASLREGPLTELFRSTEAPAVSTTAEAPIEVYASMACVRASLPLAAVISGGALRVNSGSINATSANQASWRRLDFWSWRGDINTAFFVTSAPVPAVVGTAIQGSPPPVTWRTLPK